MNAKKVGGDVELLTRVMRGSGEFSDEEWLAAKRLFSLRELQKGDHLLRAGEHAQWSVVVIQGLLREYYASPDGSEYTRTFIAREQLSGSLYDLLSNKPSITNIEALEETRLWVMRHSDFQAVCDRFPSWQRAARVFAERLYMRKIHREFQMLSMSAADRYLELRKQLGALETRIPQRHVASYLGITPEHLSRVRRKLKAH